uniref:CRAL-TRIO domain-containing protein n=1 Tax=Quercus lobata TaxID=97700 RepID=A0A7N2L7G7_QUELO
MEKNQEMALTQMRKSVEKLGSSTEGYGDPTLMRFLIARSMDQDKAAKMFVQWQNWRAAMAPNGAISESEIQDELEPRKIYLQGLSKDKYPVMIVKASKHFPSKDNVQFKRYVPPKGNYVVMVAIMKSSEPLPNDCLCLEKLTEALASVQNQRSLLNSLRLLMHVEFVVHLLDKTIASSFKGREIGNEKLIGILDLQNIGYKNIDARGLITGFQFLQAYYPERLAKCFILHMPRFFVSVWRMVSRFLEKATLEKIVIVTNEDERLDFIKEVGEEVLPEEYGGRAKLVAIQDVVLASLEG